MSRCPLITDQTMGRVIIHNWAMEQDDRSCPVVWPAADGTCTVLIMLDTMRVVIQLRNFGWYTAIIMRDPRPRHWRLMSHVMY